MFLVELKCQSRFNDR